MTRFTILILLCMLASCGSPPLLQIAEFSATDGILKHVFNRKFSVNFRPIGGANTARVTLNEDDWIDFSIDRVNKVLTATTRFTKRHEVKIVFKPTSGEHGFYRVDGERQAYLVLDSDGQKSVVKWR